MKRFARVALLWVVGALCGGAGLAQAQTTGSASADPKIYAEFNFGPTLGHKSDTFLGVEAGWRFYTGLDVFVEGGQMKNVGTAQLDANAALIANCCIPGGTVSSTSKKVNYFNVGVRYQLDQQLHMPTVQRLHPYVLLGAGSASVTTDATFAVSGNVVDPSAFGVQLGGDLSGSTRKGMVIFGLGLNVPFLQRYYADVGYRYGQIFAKTGDVETDESLKTQRIAFGVGVKF
jgi:opacity protein-like surface antigen